MIRRVAACAALVLALPFAASAATLAQLDAWLASTPAIVRATPPSRSVQLPRYIRVNGAESASGWLDPANVTDGFLSNNQRVMAVPIISGGSGGVFTALLFTQSGGTTHFVGTISSGAGHLGVSLMGGHLLVQRPVYGANDPNCCPSALHYERATLHGTRLVSEDQWEVKLAR